MNLMKTVAALLVVGLLATSALAQDRPGGGQGRQGGGRMGMGMGMQSSPAMLAFRNDVQKDIKVTADQKKKLDEITQRMQTTMQQRMEQMRSSGERPDPNTMRAEFEKFQKDTDEAVNAVLNDEQKKRLGQISLQMGGPQAMMRPEVQKDLGLTRQQIRSMEDLMDKMNEANQAVFARVQSGELERDQVRQIMEQNRTALGVEFEKLLTAEQKTKLAEMRGPKFTADPNERGMQMGRGGRGGGGN